MSEFHVGQSGFREVYITDGARGRIPGGGPVGIISVGPTSPTYKMGTPTYRSGVIVERDLTRPPRPVATFTRTVDPSSGNPQRSQITYRLQETYNKTPVSSRNSPPPPPYSSPRHSPTSSRIHVYHRALSPSRQHVTAVPVEVIHQGSPVRSPSPFQERKDIETLVPTYTASYPLDVRPKSHSPDHITLHVQRVPVQSKTSPASVETGQFTPLESRPVRVQQVVRPKSDPTTPAPRPYQLVPTMDTRGAQSSESLERTTPEGKEAEVDALTNLLIQSMEVSGDPDFFGMCVKCGRAIMGDNSGCSALDQLFHIECFTCATCDIRLKGHPFFAMEGKPYCESCYMNTLEKCSVCSAPITDRILRATGKPYHPTCFTCVICGKSLDGVQFTVDATNQIHCIEDFHKKFAPRCCVCTLPIMPDNGQEETIRIVAMDRSFHTKCYKCEDCSLLLSSEAEGRGCYPLDESILCKQCNAKRIQAMTTRMMTEL